MRITTHKEKEIIRTYYELVSDTGVNYAIARASRKHGASKKFVKMLLNSFSWSVFE